MDDRSWANSVLSKLDAKMTYGVQKAQTLDGIPYTVQGSEWKSNGIGWWTNGFWPAEMWQMYLATGKELYRAEALRAETLMDEALKNFTRLHHDVGFLWLINSGVHYALDGNADSLTRCSPETSSPDAITPTALSARGTTTTTARAPAGRSSTR